MYLKKRHIVFLLLMQAVLALISLYMFYYSVSLIDKSENESKYYLELREKYVLEKTKDELINSFILIHKNNKASLQTYNSLIKNFSQVILGVSIMQILFLCIFYFSNNLPKGISEDIN